MPDGRGSHRLSPATLAAGACVGGVLLLALTALAAQITDRPLGFFTRDPTAVLEGPLYAGALSAIGVLLWWTGVAVAGFAALLRPGDDRRGFLAAAAALTAVLAFDDLFQVHDVLLPDYAGIPQPAVTGAYGLAAVALVVRWRATMRRTAWKVALAGAALFAVSVAVDFVGDQSATSNHLLEDGAKLLGIITWTTYLASVAAAALAPDREASALGRE